MVKLKFSLLLLLNCSISFSQVFITELADPENNFNARYIELYNSGGTSVNLSGWRIDKYLNASSVLQRLELNGTIASGEFFIVGDGASANTTFNTVYGFEPDQIGILQYGVAGGNGDDNLELYNAANELIDTYGVVGVDGTGSARDFWDGRSERKASAPYGDKTFNVNNWIVEGVNNGGSGVDAPDGFDPKDWVGAFSYDQTFVPGNTYYDSTGYVEYRAGNLPVILSAPHGGLLEPETIPDRDCSGCVIVKDTHTKAVTEGIYDAFIQQTGCYPHVIINLLHRKKFDANRDIDDAADGNSTVEQSWYNYHNFIEGAKSQVISTNGRGLFLDIHGHGHTVQRIELGYALTAEELRLSDIELEGTAFANQSSMRTLAVDNIPGVLLPELLRGQNSFGALLDNEGFPSVPSLSDPFPQVGEAYFDALLQGYNTKRHGSRNNGGEIDGIQVELNSSIRFDLERRELFMSSLVTSVNQYLNLYYDNQYLTNLCNPITLGSQYFKKPKKEFKMYPNPAKGYIEFEGNIAKVEVEVYNLLGQKVHAELLVGSRMDVSYLKKGRYIISFIKDGSLLESMTFIKE